MARWKLMTSHYLKTNDTFWEYKETDQTTGRERRRQVPVPRYLNIYDQSDWTNRWGNTDNAAGEIVVCHEDKGDKHDVVFYGDPSPDMMPLDDEAKAISATFTETWKYKPEGAAQSYSQSMVEFFEHEVDRVAAKPSGAPTAVEIPGMTDLVAAMTMMMQQNSDIIKTLAQRKL